MTCPITAQSLADAIERALDDGIAFPELAESLESTETRWLEFHESLAPPRPVIETSDEDAPLVTVGITHFERPAKLIEAITSIARQTYENIELIVVDDGSSSTATVEALEAIEVMIRRLGGTLIRRENGYLGAARNTVAAAAKGQYLCFLDDDDIALPEMVATLVKAAANSHSDLVNCLNISMPESRRAEAWPIPGSFHNKISYLPIGGPLSLAPIQNCLGAATALISRQCFDTVGGYTEMRGVGHEDYEFFARALQAGFHLDVCPLPLYLYEVDRPSMISSTSSVRNYKRVADALDISRNSRAWHDLLSMNSGRTATEWGENRRNYLISIDKNAELLQQIVTEHDLQKLLLHLADYAGAIGSTGMERVYQLSHAHYQRMEEGSNSGEEEMMAIHQIFQSAKNAQPKNGTSGLSEVCVDILLGRPERAADRIMQRIGAQGYLGSEDVADLQALSLESISPRRAAELSDVVCGSSVPQSKIGMVLLAVFLLAVKSGNNPQSRDVFKKILEFDESIYLERNPDILEGVSKRYLASGWQHFFQNGKKEGRNGYTNTVAAYHAFITITEGDQPLKKFVEDFGNEGFGSVGANARLSSL